MKKKAPLPDPLPASRGEGEEPPSPAPETDKTAEDIAHEELAKLPVVEVTSVDVLEAACREPVFAEFTFGAGDKKRLWKVPGRLLTPAETDRVNLIMERALPDLVSGQSGADGETRYDLRNPEYLAAKTKYRAQAMALALYLAYPMFKENERVKAVTTPALKMELLTDVIHTFFTDKIRETLWVTVIGYSRLWERVNFF
jgi:hypothetical protein